MAKAEIPVKTCAVADMIKRWLLEFGYAPASWRANKFSGGRFETIINFFAPSDVLKPELVVIISNEQVSVRRRYSDDIRVGLLADPDLGSKMRDIITNLLNR